MTDLRSLFLDPEPVDFLRALWPSLLASAVRRGDADPHAVALAEIERWSTHMLTEPVCAAGAGPQAGEAAVRQARFWTEVHASSATDLWSTPEDLYEQLNAEFGFTLDVCALPENAKCERYFTPEDDGLLQDWQGVCWMNPPYGREIGAWVEKAHHVAESGQATVVCLLPARTDTAWWHDHCMAGEIRFLRGRVEFDSANLQGRRSRCPFPSVIVVFR